MRQVVTWNYYALFNMAEAVVAQGQTVNTIVVGLVCIRGDVILNIFGGKRKSTTEISQ